MIKKTPLITVKGKKDTIEPTNFVDNFPPIINISEIKIEKPTRVKTPPPDYYYPTNPPDVILLSDDDNKETVKPKNEPEDIFIDDDITMELPEMEVNNERTVIQPANTSIQVDVFDDGNKFILNKHKSKKIYI